MMIWSEYRKDTSPVTVTVSDQATLLADVEDHLYRREGFCVATLNLDHVAKLARDKAFRNAYARHGYITADGNPIVWLCRLAGQSDVSLVPGSELVEPLCSVAAQQSVGVALVGSTDTSLAAAAQALVARHPGLDIVLRHAPVMGFDPTGPDADETAAAISTSGAGLVFVALGAPKQEKFAAYAQSVMPDVGFVSVGAGLDFLSGVQIRAPKWVRVLALEWLWRMLSDPRRLVRRYGACVAVLPRLVFRALATRRRIGTS